MCLAVPGKIIEIKLVDGLRMCKVDVGGVYREACLVYLPEARVGDYTVIHVGFAISRLSEEEAHASLKSLQEITGFQGKISLIQLNIPGSAPEIERMARELASPGIEARPVRQIVDSSGRVLGTIRGLTVSLTGLIVIIIALSVTATMTTIVLERRKDVAVMKALGAGDRLVIDLFLSEGATLGLAGALIGFALGLVLARFMAEKLFDVALTPAWWTLPAVALGGTLLAVVATILPVRMVRGVQPATVLKGE